VTLGTSIYVASYPGLRREFGVSTELATAGLSTFTLALGVGSLFWAPLSETAGRKPVLVSSLTMYVLFGLGPVLGHNIETLVITRCASLVSRPSAATVADTGCTWLSSPIKFLHGLLRQ
jgi:MFS family permease